MKLPLSTFFEKKEKTDYFLAALLRDDKVKLILFEEISGKIKVITQNEEHFATSLEEASISEWTNVFDKAIGTIEATLPGNSIVKKTVFGVKQIWTDEGKIKKEYLMKLKKVSEELDLEPIGFLVFSEAIVHLLQKEQGTPVSGILVEVGKKIITVTILRAGKVIEIRSHPIEESPVKTVDTILKHVTNVEILPSKMILFDGEHHASGFLKHQWSPTLPFLHLPQVTVLDKNFDVKAIIEGTAAQLGLQVMEDEQITESSEIKKQDDALPNEIVNEEVQQPNTHEDYAEKEENEILGMDAFGFIKDSDVKLEEIPPVSPEEIHEAIGSQIPAYETTSPVLEPEVPRPSFADIAKEKIILGRNSITKFIHRREKAPAQQKELSFSQPIMDEPYQEKRKTKTMKLPKLAFIVPAVLIILVAGFIWYIMNVKATIVLTLTPKVLSQDETITFSTDSDTNLDGGIIHGSVIDISEDGSVSTNATGTKDIGTPAKGSVTIFNNNDSSKTLNAGTTITSSNNMKYTLDKDITIASASGDIFSGTTPGKADGAVTATSIGEEYNLPSNTKFSVAGSSSLAAKNNNAFSGGTKKQATVVSKSDIDKLMKDLPDSLTNKARDEFNKQTSGDKAVLPIITKSSIDKKKLDKNIGDEAKTVTLTATISFKSIAYDKSALKEYGLHVMKSKAADSTTLIENSIETNLHDATAKNEGVAKAGVKIDGSFTSAIDTAKIKKDIAGKSFAEAQQIMSSIPQYTDAAITLSPNMLFFPKQLPKFDNHIVLTIETK